jgi:hypothetical protein
MASSLQISNKELERVAALCYEGLTLRAMLCENGGNGLTANSTIADWQGVEITGSGYQRFSAEVGTGSYSSAILSYRMPAITATFTASGAGYFFDTLVVYFEGTDYPHGVLPEASLQALLAGQTKTYRITLATLR